MKHVAAAFAAVILSGCAQWSSFQQHGANAADGVLEGGLYATCVAATAGSLVRRYGNDPDGRAAWNLMCSHEWARGSGSFELPEVSGGR